MFKMKVKKRFQNNTKIITKSSLEQGVGETTGFNQGLTLKGELEGQEKVRGGPLPRRESDLPERQREAQTCPGPLCLSSSSHLLPVATRPAATGTHLTLSKLLTHRNCER